MLFVSWHSFCRFHVAYLLLSSSAPFLSLLSSLLTHTFTFSTLRLSSLSSWNSSFSRAIITYHFFTCHRDPAQHASLKSEIENQSTAYYSTARLWDDGIIKPTDTRDVLGLGLGIVNRERILRGGRFGTSTTWDGDNKGFGVFRM
ncbi:hypothetical protein D9756_000185 [Leucocoprinus leucothites]|uniref:Uncharacterized protein n=1 Tax=Leucocoprinus leucothites TaxID=201217 RepID=A0A8H5GGF4_9AGAR|nr:hypothetical protein D9756_000185 [Leucoagaricus leucothites]